MSQALTSVEREQAVGLRSLDSQGRTNVAAVRPCVVALREDRVLPADVTGPRDFAPFRREAAR